MMTKKPNIVYVLADDMGYGDVSSQNPAGKIQTPNIDRLAREGMAFTDAHSCSAVCSPSRYSILTGRYNWRSQGTESICCVPRVNPGLYHVGALPLSSVAGGMPVFP